MATMDVRDAEGNATQIEKPLAPGRAAATASRPVVFSTEDLAAINAVTAKLIEVKSAVEAIPNAATALTPLLDQVEALIQTSNERLAELVTATGTTTVGAINTLNSYVDELEGLIRSADVLRVGTDRSGVTTADTEGATSSVVAEANSSRRRLTIQNISDEALWVNQSGSAAQASTAGNYKIATGAIFEVTTNQEVSIIGSVAGKAYTATET